VGLAEEIAGARSLALYELLRQRLVKEVPVAAPAVGAEWAQAVPAGVAWEVLSVQQSLATSAVVATRNPMLRALDPSGNEVGRIGPAATLAGSLTNTYTYWPGFGYASSIGRAQMSLPDPALLLPAGFVLGSVTSALDVGDQYSAIVLMVREWQVREVLAAADWLADHVR
jgi:hypothetical protein